MVIADMETDDGVGRIQCHHMLLGHAADALAGAAVAEGRGNGRPLAVQVHVA